jgi:hypothetical protein
MRMNKILLAISAIVILLILSIGGVVTYGILFPPVWTEQLAYKNSTGQGQVITMYRNATDVSYNNLTSFLTANDIEHLVYADPGYRPVEYAALLHDKAEAGGINCTIIASGIINNTPANAIDAFFTTDKGMVYVDTTAMNVSPDNYTVPFSEIRLLRERWATPTPWTDYDGQYVTIKTYRDAKPVRYNDLMAFLDLDRSENRLYVMPSYTCVDFSATLYNNAEANGIKCGLVAVRFEEPVPGHAFNAFLTSDRGVVYIDSTGVNETYFRDGNIATDNNVYMQVGSRLGELPDNQTNGNLDYAFYADRMERINVFRAKLDQYNKDVESYNNSCLALDADLNNFNAQMNKHNSAIAAFNSGNENEYRSYLHGVITYDQYMSWYNTNSAGIPRAPTGGAMLDSRKGTLDQQCINLNNRRQELLNSEESKWITFNPVGTIASESTYWP